MKVENMLSGNIYYVITQNHWLIRYKHTHDGVVKAYGGLHLKGSSHTVRVGWIVPASSFKEIREVTEKEIELYMKEIENKVYEPSVGVVSIFN